MVAPASPPLDPERIPTALLRLKGQGFRIKPGKHLEARTGYLAGSDEERAADLQAAFADPEVDGIIALRGGYGSCRILPLLDYAAIHAHPKIFLGYSDNTALHQALLKKAGLLTLHGPNSSEAFLPSNAAYMKQVLQNAIPEAKADLLSAPGAGKMTTLVKGKARGRLIGGNMTCLLRLLGTSFAPDFRGAILFLEDIGEKAYRVDGMFTHLRLAGALTQISGLIIGKFTHPDEGENERIRACLELEANAVGLPCLSDAPIGHFPEQAILPHGAEVELDAEARTLRLA